MGIASGWRFFIVAGLSLSAAGNAIAAEIPLIRGVAGLPDIQIFERIEESLTPFGRKEEMISSSVALGQGHRGSHVRLRYDAKHPVPIVFVFARAQQYKYETDPDLVMAVLPSGIDREVFLSLMESPSWSRNRNEGIVLNIYGFPDAMISIEEAEFVDRTTVFSRLQPAFRHLFIPEQMRIASMNIMRGYRMYGVPFNAILGFMFVAGALFIGIRWKERRLMHIATLACVIILAYQARAGMDFIRTAAVDATEWITTGMNKEYGDLHFAINGVRALEQESAKKIFIATCGGYERPLEYFLSPLPVDSDAAGWSEATHAVLPPIWMQEGRFIVCDSQRREGRILATYPKGSALAEFQSPQ